MKKIKAFPLVVIAIIILVLCNNVDEGTSTVNTVYHAPLPIAPHPSRPNLAHRPKVGDMGLTFGLTINNASFGDTASTSRKTSVWDELDKRRKLLPN